ncbi:MAG TPA: hypothetical protein VGW31_05300 [Hanamia sp.]|nr:hypothetical protein [Hanamia sp.]
MRNDPKVRQQMFDFTEEWKQSGLSQKAFCERHSIRFHKYYYWYKRYQRQHDVEAQLGSAV